MNTLLGAVTSNLYIFGEWLSSKGNMANQFLKIYNDSGFQLQNLYCGDILSKVVFFKYKSIWKGLLQDVDDRSTC
jgi:hypothetical protein